MKPSRRASVRQAKYSGKNTITMKMDMAGLNRLVDMLQAEVSDAIRPAAQAAAQVLYNEVKKNVASIGKKTGNLEQSIYQAFSKDNSEDGKKAVYHISWNAKKAPHGHLVEYGHIQTRQTILTKAGKWVTLKRPLKGGPRHVAARPFIRPAMAKASEAAAVAELELLRYLNEGPIKSGGGL